ncbi:MAG: thiamine ABC transporter substrate binding subunit [Spirochaetaceae bacterium]|nr:thiamine ABC transporter substrate binding subunit [Spirochaetaceae bacterium]
MTLSSRGRGRILVLFAFILLLAKFPAMCYAEEKRLIVFTYDSFVSEWGAGPKIAELFKEKTGISVQFVSKGDGGQLLSSLLLEREGSEADIALGLDNFTAPKALATGLFRPYEPEGFGALPSDLSVDPSHRLIPYDYGHFAIIADTAMLSNPPMSLEDLTNGAYAKKLILMDPRTSTPGLGFLAWTKAVYGERWKDYWRRLRPSVLLLAPGWDQGYGLFTAGEAPLVLSYATSPAYHLEYEGTERYKALRFADGFVTQIEVAGILASARHPRNAELFMDFLVSTACQSELPLTQWMRPVDPAAALPESFRIVPAPAKTLSIDPRGLTDDAIEAVEILSARK